MRALGVRTAAIALILGCSFAVAKADDTTSDDKKFIADSTQDSLAEINYAKLALQKSQDKNVREFATRMIKDHEKLIADMKPFAHQLKVKLPTGPALTDRAKYTELKAMSGTTFDRAYVEAMVKDHHNDLQTFIDEQAKTSNPELKAAVAKGENVIREHTEMIDNIAHMGGIQTPPMPSSAS